MPGVTISKPESHKARLQAKDDQLATMTVAEIVAFVDSATTAQLRRVVKYLVLKEKERGGA